MCLLDGHHRVYGVDLNSLLPGATPTQTAVDILLADLALVCHGLPVRILSVGTIATLTQVHGLDDAVQEMLASSALSQKEHIMFVCNDATTFPATGQHFAAMVWDTTRWVYADSLARPLCWPAAARAAKKLTHFLDAPGNAIRHTVVDRVATPQQRGPECAFYATLFVAWACGLYAGALLQDVATEARACGLRKHLRRRLLAARDAPAPAPGTGGPAGDPAKGGIGEEDVADRFAHSLEVVSRLKAASRPLPVTEAEAESAAEVGLGSLLATAKYRNAVQVPAPAGDPWTATDQSQLDKALELPPDKTVKVLGGCVITPGVLARCRPGVWGNDEIVNAYLWMVTRRAALSAAPGQHRVLCFNSFWYPTLFRQGDAQPFSFDRVSRWTANMDVFDYDLLCVPICDGLHWSVVVLYPNLRVAEYRDSLQSQDRTYEAQRCRPLNYVVRWLRIEAAAHGHDERMAETWRKMVLGKERTPQQTGGDDCAFFVCQTVSMLAAGREPSFSMTDVPGIRRRVAMELLQGWVLEPGPLSGAEPDTEPPPSAKRQLHGGSAGPPVKVPRPTVTPTAMPGAGQRAAALQARANPLLMGEGDKPPPKRRRVGSAGGPPMPVSKHEQAVRAADDRALQLRRSTPTIAQQLGATARAPAGTAAASTEPPSAAGGQARVDAVAGRGEGAAPRLGGKAPTHVSQAAGRAGSRKPVAGGAHHGPRGPAQDTPGAAGPPHRAGGRAFGRAGNRPEATGSPGRTTPGAHHRGTSPTSGASASRPNTSHRRPSGPLPPSRPSGTRHPDRTRRGQPRRGCRG